MSDSIDEHDVLVPVLNALLWVAYRIDDALASARFMRKKRGHVERALCYKSPVDVDLPLQDGLPLPASLRDADKELKAAFFAGRLALYGTRRRSGKSGIIAPNDLFFFDVLTGEGELDEEIEEIDDLLDLMVSKKDLFACFRNRDYFAKLLFARPDWSGEMVAYWTERGTSEGFFDSNDPSPINYDLVDNALKRTPTAPRAKKGVTSSTVAASEEEKEGRSLVAYLDGKPISARQWFGKSLADEPHAFFDRQQVMSQFPQAPDRLNAQLIAAEIEAAASATLTRRQAIERVNGAVPGHSRWVTTRIENDNRFEAGLRGRPPKPKKA